MITRRGALLSGIAAVCVPGVLLGQTAKFRVGVLSGLPPETSVLWPMLRRALADLGYRDGAGVKVDYRYSRASSELTELAQGMVKARCDVVFAFGEPQARAFLVARTSVPIVFIALNFDPIEARMVDSLRRPGGNLTGVYIPADALAAKRVELAREILPDISHYALVVDRATRGQTAAILKAAKAQSVGLTVIDYQAPPYDLESGFEKARKAGAKAVFLQVSAEFARRRAELSSLLVKHRLPAFVPEFMAGEKGCLASYSVDLSAAMKRVAQLGVQILNGAKPLDIPVERPDEYELVLNLRTAKAFDIKFPRTVLARATRIIE